LEVDVKIGVSGASGHLGRAVVSELLQRSDGHEVVAITCTPETVSGPAEERFGDYTNISGVTSRNKCDWSAVRRQSARGHLLALRRSHAKMKADIGVSEVEKQAAGAGEDA
jgi:nucleoside-diphosphate-sugar epimerase